MSILSHFFLDIITFPRLCTCYDIFFFVSYRLTKFCHLFLYIFSKLISFHNLNDRVVFSRLQIFCQIIIIIIIQKYQFSGVILDIQSKIILKKIKDSLEFHYFIPHNPLKFWTVKNSRIHNVIKNNLSFRRLTSINRVHPLKIQMSPNSNFPPKINISQQLKYLPTNSISYSTSLLPTPSRMSNARLRWRCHQIYQNSHRLGNWECFNYGYPLNWINAYLIEM